MSPEMLLVARAHLQLTRGGLRPEGEDWLSMVGPSVRAHLKTGRSSSGVLLFRYLGPTTETVELASAGPVRQIGLKLCALNTCNLLYVMWRIEPREEILLAIKRNPGLATHTECGARGYNEVARLAVPGSSCSATGGQVCRLQASVGGPHDGFVTTIQVGDEKIWSGPLESQHMSGLSGPTGIRADNGRFEFKLLVPVS
jgi:hypothetical protein